MASLRSWAYFELISSVAIREANPAEADALIEHAERLIEDAGNIERLTSHYMQVTAQVLFWQQFNVDAFVQANIRKLATSKTDSK
ncbi:hypothetical protein LWC34_28455 [Kibdelosporangium philippinense]|uniref:Uncharacterized protein n=1 Tax=Kibdelosporangium philippinense TaxID=211113 RepID=A0ABS8ZHA3_9PSEU|nr:hypothetical protein [Kibdelosporangium philippinense]MCE7006729.1 hypothetical protein [Kibdelosporangium philippinense]